MIIRSAVLRNCTFQGFLFSTLFILFTFNVAPQVWSQSVTEQIIVDQFGWRTNARKTVIFANPVSGQNIGNPYTPGSQFQVRRSTDNTIVFTGNTVVWNSGNTHTISGDQVWHGDFTSVTAPGTYHIYDPTRNLRSYEFEIRDNIYGEVLQAAVKMFYYQRSGVEIPAQHGSNWTHPLAHSQDASALLYTSEAQPGTARDVRGGWYDAGDYNKYVPFMTSTMWDLLMAYELRPNAFTDATNIPESGNGVPDVLDELKWELDWMLRMQAASGGVHNRVTVTSHSSGTDDPSTDTQARYYTNITTWSTATFAAIMAHAARVFGAYGNQFPNYASTLHTAAENAWLYLENNPSMSPSTGKDGATMASVDAGSNVNEDRRRRILAAAQLFRTTGNTKYKTYFESNYNNTSATSQDGFHPLSNYMDPTKCWDLNLAFVTYWGTSGADATIVSQLKNSLKKTVDWYHEPKYNQKEDPYLGYMFNGHYAWGSNWLKARWAQLAVIALESNINSTKNGLYREIAEEYLHYFHGRNPLSWIYLSNMGTRGANIGGDKNVEEFFHKWFRDGSSRYDGPKSQFGAAPGYLVGGPNQYYSGTTSPPKGNPPMKAFAAWNTDWPDPSWEVTEPAIYYQAAYVFLASYFAEPPSPSVQRSLAASNNSPVCVGQTLQLTATPTNLDGSTYSWSGPNGYASTEQNPSIPNATTGHSGSYTVTAIHNGSNYTASTTVSVNPLPVASATSNSPVEAGQTLNLFAASAGEGAGYSWSGPDNFNSTQQNPSIANVSTAAAGTYTLTVSLNGCTASATTSVTINEPTNVQRSLAASSNSPVCVGQTLQLTATPTNLDGSTYSWSGPNGYASTEQNPSIPNATTGHSGSYTVTAIHNSSNYTASTTVSVNPLPVASATSNSPVEAGQTLNLFAASAGEGAGYSWSGPDNFNSTQQNPSIANVSTAAAGTYTLTVNLNGCTASATTSVTVTAIVVRSNIIYDDVLMPGWLDYSWGTSLNFSDNNPVQSGSNAISVTYSEAWGSLYLHTDSPFNLSGYSHLKFWVHGGAKGNQKIVVKMNDDNNNKYSLTVPAKKWTLVTVPLSTFGSPATLNKLYFQENLGSNKQATYSIDQIYLATSATAREGFEEEVVSIIPSLEVEQDVKVYPNPVDAQQAILRLQFLGFETNEELQLQFTDLHGRILKQRKITLYTPEKELSLGRIAPGIYLIRLQTKQGQLIRKVMVK